MKTAAKPAIIVGRFQPLTKGHLKLILEAKRKGLEPVLCMIDTKKTDERKPWDSRFLLDLYAEPMKKLGFRIVLVKSADIVEIGKAIPGMGLQPAASQMGWPAASRIRAWFCGTDRYKDYARMVDKYGAEAGLDPEFELVEIPRSDEDISATKCREAIVSGDFATFSKLYIYPDKKVFELLKTNHMVK